MTELKPQEAPASPTPPANLAAPSPSGSTPPVETNGAPSTAPSSAPPGSTSAVPSASAPSAVVGGAGTPEDLTETVKTGNPFRVVRGGSAFLGGGLVAFLLMANSVQLRWGVPLGLVALLVATWGVLDLFGTFDDPEERVVTSMSLGVLARPLALAVGGFLLFCGALMAAQSAPGPQIVWGLAVTASFLTFVVALFGLGVALGPWAVDEAGRARPFYRREGFWLIAIGALLYFPFLGAYSLSDPWETHYGEVAREILSRDDWISLWWVQDGWFWSKPILNFWIQALAMASLGTGYKPGTVLATSHGFTAHPEWVMRTPNVLLTILAMYVLYKGVAKVFGRRAGLFGGIVLATMPDWYFLAHQTMTDMPFVAPMTTTMGLLLIGLNTDKDALAGLYEVKVGGARFRLSAYHLVFGTIILVTLAQVLYLFSRNVEFLVFGDGPKGFRLHWDEFKSGSPGNCGQPGNEACAAQTPASVPKSYKPGVDAAGNLLLRTFGSFEPFLQATLWGGLLAFLLYGNWGERRLRRLFYLAAWFFAAIATMGKGPAGFAVPIICAFAYIATEKRWDELLRLEIVSGLIIILCVALPWYVAMFVRHGTPFTDRLIFHDMFNRAFGHVHDTNEGDDTSFRFYIWQLGYALFPWTGLAPLGLTWWMRRRDHSDGGRGDVSVLLVMWFLFCFALFSFMGTKFHHYIFPAVPPVAMLIGIVLASFASGEPLSRTQKDGPLYVLAMLVGSACLVLGVSRFFPGTPFGTTSGAAPSSPLPPPIEGFSVPGLALVLLGTLALVLAVRFFGAPPADDLAARLSESPTAEQERRHERLLLGAAALAGIFQLALVARDLVLKPEFADQPGAIRFLHLFTYQYRRPWPDSLDFSGILFAFSIVAVLLTALFVVPRLRKHIAIAMLAFGGIWALWGLDAYMMKTAPHWGQREVIEAYYRDRKSRQEPLVCYQMNWKGENFYTGNEAPVFVSTGAPFSAWLRKKRDEGVKTIYLVTEHHRLGGLKSEVGAKSYAELTDRILNNKFVLVRAEL